MGPFKDQETPVNPPLTVNHETSKLYSALRQCMENNKQLREALVQATETIQLLTDKLNETNS
jgi:hypothetical protein